MRVIGLLGISQGTRRSVERRSMYRTQVVWLEADALYAFEGRQYGGEIRIDTNPVCSSIAE